MRPGRSIGPAALLSLLLLAGGALALGSPPARVVKLKGIEFDLQAKRVTMEGRISLASGLVELLACVRGTKDYESVVALDCQPYDLHLGLLALGLKPGQPVNRQEAGELPQGPPVTVRVEWKDGEGKTVSRRAEELILNIKTKQPMEETDWVFVGSRFVRDEDRGKEVYAAALTGAVITTYHDPTTVLDNPHATGGDDTLFVVNQKLVPPAGTPVRVVVEPKKSTDAPPEP